MKKILSAAILATGLLAATSALAQNTSTATASGSATIIRPITITQVQDLQFGRIIRPSTGSGTVTMGNTSDTVTASGGPFVLGGITTRRAEFTIASEGGQAFSLSVPANLTMVKGADSIVVTLNPSLGALPTVTGALGSGVSQTLYVGGSFPLPDTQATGAYTANFSVTVTYN